MTIQVQIRIEGRRGCGYRKPGGIYLVAPPIGHPCCKLPWPLETCPCCGAGFKPSRGWTWVDAEKLFKGLECTMYDAFIAGRCPLNNPKEIGMAGLIWIGEAYYKTVEDFQAEANLMGISRRISTVPKGFKLGGTWVLLAHRKGIRKAAKALDVNAQWPAQGNLPTIDTYIWTPAIFTIFKPQAIEYVVKGDETEEDLERLVKRGLTPIKVQNKVPYHG